MLQIAAVRGLPEVRQGDDLPALLVAALNAGGLELGTLRDGDVVVVASQTVSTAAGRVVQLDHVTPSSLAHAWAAQSGKDPRIVEVVLGEAARIVRMDRGVLIAQTHHGLTCADAGVDASAASASGSVVLLPEDPDRAARELRRRLVVLTGADIATVISHPFGRPWRRGLTRVAIGAAGISAVRRYAGAHDPAGYELRATEIALLDELTACADLAAGAHSCTPVVVLRGVEYARPVPGTADPGAAALIRSAQTDMFR